MFAKHFPALLTLALALPALVTADSKLLRHPSYHNGRIAFSYLGDIWVVKDDGSDPRRLTDNQARDVYPRFSPDGKWIAFSSNRPGNYDVFVMSTEGGEPRQLTFHSGVDTVVGWTPDSKRVLFSSARGRVFPNVLSLYEIPVDGGLEQAVPTDWGSSGSYSPDGKKLAFTRHPGTWWRKHYRGSYAGDLWVMDVASKAFRPLSDPEFKGNHLWPMYSRNGEIYFVADRLANEKGIQYGGPEVMKSANNIWKVSDRGGKPSQVTQHKDGSLFFPSMSADGKVIVYEENFGLWMLDTASGKTRQVNVNISVDPKENAVEWKTFDSEAESFSLSPSSRRAAISVHGEIFTVATERGEPQRVTDTPWRDSAPLWSPDGKLIAFASDRSGREEIWISDERGQTAKKLSDSDTEKGAVNWSRDSKSLLYTASDHKLYRVDVASGETKVITSSDVGSVASPQFSPDDQWIAYSKMDRDLRSKVFIIPAAGGQERAIGEGDLFSAQEPRWTGDGKKLLMLAGTQQRGVASTRSATSQLYSVSLTREDKNPLDRGVDSEEEAAAATPATPGGRGPRGGAEAAAKVEVKIDWDDINRRIRQVTRLGDNVFSVTSSPDGRTYAFVTVGPAEGGRGFGGASSLYTVQENGDRLTRVAQSQPRADADGPPQRGRGGFGGGISSPQFSRDGRTLYYLDRDAIYSVSLAQAGEGATAAAAAGPAATARPAERGRRVNFSVRVPVDVRAERKQVFEEGWRIMKYRFYDAKMHGVDWISMKEIYESLLPHVADTEELHNVMLQMIGELNASHTGVSGGETERSPLVTRSPGFELETDPSGFYKVAYIYKKGPADHDYVRIAPGNFVLALNDQDFKVPDNYWQLLTVAPGRRFEFTVNSKPSKDGAWKVKVEPVSGPAFATLQYEKWVDERKAMADKLSGGEIGYLHIRAMDAPSLRKFELDLVENRFKKALIIDERFNGGGGIDQELLQILQQRRYQATRSRDSVEVSRPQRAYFGPMVVMQNERSASDAEMFPDGFRALGLGKVIGVPTMGAVIGTGSYRLLDGSQIRTPGSGVFTAKGVNMENYGVPPDVYVDNTPDDFLKGRDAQLEKAVDTLKDEMRRRAGAGGNN